MVLMVTITFKLHMDGAIKKTKSVAELMSHQLNL